MKKKQKICAVLFGLLCMFLLSPIAVSAESLPETTEGEKVELTDFQILYVPKSWYYKFENMNRQFMDYDEMVREIQTVGMKYKISYTVDGKQYDSIGTVSETNDVYGVTTDTPGIWGRYDGLRLYVTWKNVTKGKTEDGEEYYQLDTKSNAICCRCGDRTVEIPVKFDQPSPVKSITVLENPWAAGIYGYKYFEMSRKSNWSGLKLKISYRDGRDDKILEWPDQDSCNEMEVDGYWVMLSAEGGNGTPGEDFDAENFEIFYMGASTKFQVPLLKNPVKKIELKKNPAKMTYKLVSDTPDLYGAVVKITYRNGKSESKKITTHKSAIPVNNKYKESIELSYYGAGKLWIEYLGASLILDVPTKISDLGAAKKLSVDKDRVETFTAKASDRLFVVEPAKTGRYQMEYSTKWVYLKTGMKKNGHNEFKIYLLSEEGKCLGSDFGDILEFGLKKGEKYYIYVYDEKWNYINDDGGKPYRKLEFTAGLSYKGALKKQKISISDMKKTYGDAAFVIKASTGTESTLSYTSSNKKVAVVTKDGKVTIKGAGTTKITVKASACDIYRETEKTVKLTVRKAKGSLTVAKTEYQKTYGDKKFSLGAKGKGTLTYATDNASVATVKKGVVTIKGCGQAVITVKSGSANYKTVTRKIKVIVVPEKASLLQVKSTKAGTLTVRWSRQDNADGYKIEYTTDKQFKKNIKSVVVKRNTAVNTDLEKLVRGKNYYVRIKAYTLLGRKKAYGETSGILKAKVR